MCYYYVIIISKPPSLNPPLWTPDESEVLGKPAAVSGIPPLQYRERERDIRVGMYMYVYIYIYKCILTIIICMCVYIYIYIERERCQIWPSQSPEASGFSLCGLAAPVPALDGHSTDQKRTIPLGVSPDEGPTCESRQPPDEVGTNGVVTEVPRFPTINFHGKMWQHVAKYMVFVARWGRLAVGLPITEAKPGPGLGRLAMEKREMGGAPRNPAPRNRSSVWVCQTIRPPLHKWALEKQSFHWGLKHIVECRPPLGAIPLSPRRLFEWSFRACGRPKLLLRMLTDGIGTPDPNPRNLVNWCF